METSKPHSIQDDFATLRTEAEWRISHVRDELNAAITRIEERFKADMNEIDRLVGAALSDEEMFEAITSITRRYITPLNPACEHEWVDATNAVVESGEVCVKCYAIRAV